MGANVGGDLSITVIPGINGVEWVIARGNMVLGNIVKSPQNKFQVHFLGTRIGPAEDFHTAKGMLFQHLRDANASLERRVAKPEFNDEEFRTQMTALYYYLWHKKISPLKLIEILKISTTSKGVDASDSSAG